MKIWLFLKTNKDVRIVLSMFVLAVIFYLLSGTLGDKSGKCEEVGGKWLKKYRECENTTLSECVGMSGIYNFCASPCRHYRDQNIAEVCDFKCTGVCEFIRFSKK